MSRMDRTGWALALLAAALACAPLVCLGEEPRQSDDDSQRSAVPAEDTAKKPPQAKKEREDLYKRELERLDPEGFEVVRNDDGELETYRIDPEEGTRSKLSAKDQEGLIHFLAGGGKKEVESANADYNAAAKRAETEAKAGSTSDEATEALAGAKAALVKAWTENWAGIDNFRFNSPEEAQSAAEALTRRNAPAGGGLLEAHKERRPARGEGEEGPPPGPPKAASGKGAEGVKARTKEDALKEAQGVPHLEQHQVKSGITPLPAPGAGPGGEKPRKADGLSRAEMIKDIVSRGLVADGISAEAAKVAERTITQMIQNADSKVLANLIDKDVRVYVVPTDKKLVDLAPFASLKGQKTFDGRLWDDVRGVGGMPFKGGVAIGVPEENLIAGNGKDSRGYPARFTLVHEFGHAVQNYGLPKNAAQKEAPGLFSRTTSAAGAFVHGLGSWTKPDFSTAWTGAKLAFSDRGGEVSRKATVDLYQQAMKTPGKTGLGWYANANPHENFAESTAAYFGVGMHSDDGRKTRTTYLGQAQPGMSQMMYAVYGPPLNLHQ